jgi:hypothetical protein
LLALAPVAAGVGWWLNREATPDAAVALSPVPTSAPATTLVAFTPPVGERTTAARCWMVVIDESSSMATADSAGTRADAVRAAADFLGAYGVDGDRIGATWFSDAADVLAPARPDRAALAPSGRVVLGGGTQIATALEQSFAAMATACGDAKQVVVLVSDGAASSQSDFAATAAILAGAPDVDVHLIAMNENGAFEAARPFWSDATLGLDSTQTIDDFGRDQVAAAVAQVLSFETGQQVSAT